MQHRIKQRACVTVGQDEAVPVDELGILGRKLHDIGKQNMGDRGATYVGDIKRMSLGVPTRQSCVDMA